MEDLLISKNKNHDIKEVEASEVVGAICRLYGESCRELRRTPEQWEEVHSIVCRVLVWCADTVKCIKEDYSKKRAECVTFLRKKGMWKEDFPKGADDEDVREAASMIYCRFSSEYGFSDMDFLHEDANAVLIYASEVLGGMEEMCEYEIREAKEKLASVGKPTTFGQKVDFKSKIRVSPIRVKGGADKPMPSTSARPDVPTVTSVETLAPGTIRVEEEPIDVLSDSSMNHSPDGRTKGPGEIGNKARFALLRRGRGRPRKDGTGPLRLVKRTFVMSDDSEEELTSLTQPEEETTSEKPAEKKRKDLAAVLPPTQSTQNIL